MDISTVMVYVIDLVWCPLNFLFAIIYQFLSLVLGSILVIGCLIKLLFKIGNNNYEGKDDMKGKTVLITGADAGIGKTTAFNLARRNAHVLLACRNVAKGKEVAEEIKSATGNQNVIIKSLDLSSFESVRQCAKSVLETEDKLHVLINNESILYRKGDLRIGTNDRCDIVMQTNHFGPFLLTLLLLDLLKRSSPSRIINVTSEVYMNAKFDIEDLNNDRGTIDQLYVYYNSKLANFLFTKELSKRLQGTGVTVNSLYPGMIPSDFVEPSFKVKIILFLIAKTFEEGAQTTIRLAVDPALETTTGKHFFNCGEGFFIPKEAEDTVLTKRLFELSERIVGISL